MGHPVYHNLLPKSQNTAQYSKIQEYEYEYVKSITLYLVFISYLDASVLVATSSSSVTQSSSSISEIPLLLVPIV